MATRLDTSTIPASLMPTLSFIDGLIILFALREIVPGEEITVDYLNSFEEDRSVCHCRTASCLKELLIRSCVSSLGNKYETPGHSSVSSDKTVISLKDQ